MKYNKKVIMLILDGFGIAKPDKFNAIDNANKPNFDKLVAKYPNVSIKTDAAAVGLPEGQSGTSEINHQTIGSGRVVLQDLPRINTEIETGTFFDNEALVTSALHTIKNKSRLHVVGILSDGGIHSKMNHLKAIFELAKRHEVKEVFVHAFTDGRDTPPQSAARYFKELDAEIAKYKNIKLATVQGRYYLDRDRDWDKTNMALDLITEAKGMPITTWQNAIDFEYNQNQNDEFFRQILINENGVIKGGDAVIFTHYRSDRLYQIVKALVDKKIEKLQVTTFIEVSEDIKTDVAFPRPLLTNTLSEVLSNNNKIQYHLTETEKYTHLTYFFNGGKEKELPNETWELIKSNRFVKPHYNFEPSMQSFTITQKLIDKIIENKTDFMVVNYPNADMVGHSGNYSAALVAVEAVDYCLGKIYEAIEDKLDEYAIIITADHGNAEQMWDYESNQPHTQHTLSPVPLILISDIDCKLDKKESLEDVAPTVLTLMGLEIPEIMNGTNLILPK